MKFFSYNKSKLALLSNNTIKKNPSQDMLGKNNPNRHSKGTLATAKALNNLLGL
jgi:hypothetical protein